MRLSRVGARWVICTSPYRTKNRFGSMESQRTPANRTAGVWLRLGLISYDKEGSEEGTACSEAL